MGQAHFEVSLKLNFSVVKVDCFACDLNCISITQSLGNLVTSVLHICVNQVLGTFVIRQGYYMHWIQVLVCIVFKFYTCILKLGMLETIYKRSVSASSCLLVKDARAFKNSGDSYS